MAAVKLESETGNEEKARLLLQSAPTARVMMKAAKEKTQDILPFVAISI